MSSSGSIGTSCCLITSPPSNSSFTQWTEHPVTLSLLSRACSIACNPLYLGSKDGCKFIIFFGNASINSGDITFIHPARIIKSTLHACSSMIIWSSSADLMWTWGIPNPTARFAAPHSFLLCIINTTSCLLTVRTIFSKLDPFPLHITARRFFIAR